MEYRFPEQDVCYRSPAIANNDDLPNPMGIPAFANAIDQLKGVDIAYDSYVNEFVLGKKRIMVKPEGFTTEYDGTPFLTQTMLHIIPFLWINPMGISYKKSI